MEYCLNIGMLIFDPSCLSIAEKKIMLLPIFPEYRRFNVNNSNVKLIINQSWLLVECINRECTFVTLLCLNITHITNIDKSRVEQICSLNYPNYNYKLIECI